MTEASVAGSRALGLSAIGSGLLFLGLAALNRSGATYDADRAVFLWLRSFRDSTFDAVGHTDDVLGRVAPTFALAAIAAILLAWRGRSDWAWAVPLAIVFTGLLEFLAKLSLSRGLHIGELLAAARELVGLHYHASGSFPSGHVARTVFLASVTARFVPPFVALPFTILALITIPARLYTEAHRLSDVLGGIALGLFVASAAMWAHTRVRQQLSRAETIR